VCVGASQTTVVVVVAITVVTRRVSAVRGGVTGNHTFNADADAAGLALFAVCIAACIVW
jgi:hypothetical protein